MLVPSGNQQPKAVLPISTKSGAVFLPQTAFLTALRGDTIVKAGQVSLGLLDSPYQFRFFELSGSDVMTLGDFLDFIKSHVIYPLHAVCPADICSKF
jgi:hypothetical protein